MGRQVRALICLLQLAGLSGGRGWRPLLYAGLLLLLSSAVCGYLAVLAFWNGRALLTAGVHFIRVFVITQYFGFSIIIPWLALTATFVWGRRRYAALLLRLLPLLQDATDFAGFHDMHESKPRPQTWHLWTIVVILPIASLVINVISYLDSHSWNNSLAPMAPSFIFSILLVVLITFVQFLFQLIPVKFLLASSLLETCLRALNSALGAVVTGWDGADSSRRVRRTARLLRRVSDCLSQLTSAAAAELILSMLYGVLTQILLKVAILDILLSTGGATETVVLVSYACSTVVTLLGPCEASERMVAELGRCRGLLLRMEDARPELASSAERLQRLVTSDVDSAGDLGLYRLRRSTLLGIWSTIITYIIVMLQFLDAKHTLGDSSASFQGNITMADYI